MAGILKNQILKHLSRFVKDLSPDKISLSTLKGEGELSNLELEETVLTELLSLPTWMKLTHAYCNRALIRIQWTKLKSVPIMLSLDEVSIVVEACEELRQEASSGGNMFPTSTSKYGFVSKVIDGITAVVNTVEIKFHSQAFESKVQISRIRVESRAPNWKKADLGSTRLKDTDRGEVLIFKEMDWQTLRLEARSTSDRHLAPLRLLTNQAKARIVIKKKLSDCQVTSCRLSLILDDLLWVLTDSQILAALHFMSSLSGLIKQATETTQRVKAKRKLESLPEYQAQLSQTSAMQTEGRSASGKIFDSFDVKETSYHFLCEKIDLHFCDDPGTGRSQHPDLKDGGALQLSITQVLLDFYPYHLAKGNRKSWPKYSESQVSQWLHNALSSFRIDLLDAVSSASMHSPLARTQHQGAGLSQQNAENNPMRTAITDQLAKLMSTCLVLKVQDLRLFKVTTSSKREIPQPFLSSYIERPKDLPTIHAEFSWFYYPGEICFPLPSPKIYSHIHPIQIHLDVCTVLWLNTFISNLQNSMVKTQVASEPDHVDVRIELIMPKLVFENKINYPSQKERPTSVNFQVSRMVVSNYRSSETGTLHQLTQCLEVLQRGDLAYGAEFPSKSTDIPLIGEKFLQHAEGRDKIRQSPKLKCSSFQEMAPHLTKDMLWTEARDVWNIYMDPFWADFRVETKRKSNIPQSQQPRRINPQNPDVITSTVVYPFVDSVPISAWIHLSDRNSSVGGSCNGKASGGAKIPSEDNEISDQKNVHAIFSASGICNVQLTHYQYLFLMRMVEAFSEMSLYITLDLEQIIGTAVQENLFTFLGFIPTVELSLLFPPLVPGKQESPSLELDSTIPESSSGENDPNLPENAESQWKLIEKERQQRSSLPGATHGSFPVSMSSSPANNTSMASMDSIRTSFSQVKHGLSNLAVSFNKGGGVSTPDSEVASTWSNFSSDSSENNFIQIENLDLAEEAVEIATEVVEDNDRSTPSPTFSQEHTIIRAENDNMIGVLTVRLDGVEAGQEAKSLSAIMKLQCRAVSVRECTGMSWNEFQTKFAARNRKWAQQVVDDGPLSPAASLGSPTQKRVVKVRLSQKTNAEKFKTHLGLPETLEAVAQAKAKTPANPRINLTDRPGVESPLRKAIIESTVAFLDGRVDLRNESEFVLHMSSIMSLTDFFEDEINPVPFPMQIEIIGANVELIEDRPSMSITSPGPVPVKFSIPNLLPITRDANGVFLIGYKGYKTPPTRTHNAAGGINLTELSNNNYCNNFRSDSEPIPSNTAGNNDVMVLQGALEKTMKQLVISQAKNSDLEQELGKTQELKLMIVQLQEQVMALQEEKSNLLNIVRQYQKNQNHHK